MAKNSNNVSNSDTPNNAPEETANVAATVEAPPPKKARPTEKPRFEGETRFIYAGPSLPGGRLASHTILNGTYAEIVDYYKDAIAEYPNVARLIVPAARFAETRDKTRTSGNILYNWYTEIATAIKAKGAVE